MKRFVKALLRKKRPKESWFKYIMSVLHLWLGLLSSVVVVIVCLSGSIYTFKDKIIDAWNYDKVYVSAGNTPALPIDTIQNRLKNEGKLITAISIPSSPGKSLTISYKSVDGIQIGSFYMNPYTGENLGSGDYSLKEFFSLILSIHRSLLISGIGRDVVAASILLFVILLISGFVLWLPKKWKQLKGGLVIRWKAKFARINYDLHNVLGFYSLLLLLFIAVTGLYVSYGWVKSGIIVALGGEPVLTANSKAPVNDALSDSFKDLLKDMIATENDKENLDLEKTISLDEIIKLSNKHLPYRAITTISLPNEESPHITVKKINTENMLGAIVPDIVTFNNQGEFRTLERFADKKLHEQFVEISLPLHTGEILGWPSLIFYFIASLIGCSLPVTGFIIWWKKIPSGNKPGVVRKKKKTTQVIV